VKRPLLTWRDRALYNRIQRKCFCQGVL
jgi:hypothetical protein